MCAKSVGVTAETPQPSTGKQLPRRVHVTAKALWRRRSQVCSEGSGPRARLMWSWFRPRNSSGSSTPWSWPQVRPCRRDLAVPGRELGGIHLAMDYLKPANLVREGAMASPPITAEGKRVVIIGGGDTGADCLGTAHRQGAASVHQLEILPRPPDTRSGDNPWPTWPLIFRTSFAYEEGCKRLYEVDDHRVRGRHLGERARAAVREG